MSPRRLLAERDAATRESMDDPDCDPCALDRTYARFRPLNAILARQRSLYRRWIRPRLDREAERRLLDVGTGGADFPRRALRWATREGLRLEVLAIDPDPRAIRFAVAAGIPPGLRLQRAELSDLAAEALRYDVVVSNHLLHHLDDEELLLLLEHSARLVAVGGVVVHADLTRSGWGYSAFAVITALLGPMLRGTFIRADGLTSIRRSRTAAELRTLVPSGWQVRRVFPARLELVRDAA